MDPNHLHLHVRDPDASAAFYGRWFGLHERVRHGSIRFLSNAEGFDLALAPDPAPAPFPEWFHFGFRLPSAETVRELHGAMAAAGVPLPRGLGEDGPYVFFTCRDPDGTAIEVYWE